MLSRGLLALSILLAAETLGDEAPAENVPTSPSEQPAPNGTPQGSAPAKEEMDDTELLFDPTEEISEDLSVSFPVDI